MGLIDAGGKQLCYTGPYDLKGRDYHDQEWFYRVSRRGVFVSDAFLGYRHSPHFAIATKHERESGDYYILRATVNAEVLAEQIVTAGLTPDDDVFLGEPGRRAAVALAALRGGAEHRPRPPPAGDRRGLRARAGGRAAPACGHRLCPGCRLPVRPRLHRAPRSGDKARASPSHGCWCSLMVSIAFILGVIFLGERPVRGRAAAPTTSSAPS